jgi:two-component system, chemotaxis family, CheB/CheR fusion protein
MERFGKILMVEDHGDSAEVLNLMLARKGYSVQVARTAADARAAAATEKFDLLLCDMLLPDGDGWELCRGLCQETGLKAIALTAQGYPADLKRSAEAGCSYHLTKPVAFEVLLATIQKVLKQGASAERSQDVGTVDGSIAARVSS